MLGRGIHLERVEIVCTRMIMSQLVQWMLCACPILRVRLKVISNFHSMTTAWLVEAQVFVYIYSQ